MTTVTVNVAVAVHAYSGDPAALQLGTYSNAGGTLQIERHGGLALSGDVGKFSTLQGSLSVSAAGTTPTALEVRSAVNARVQNVLGNQWDLSASDVPLPLNHRLHPTHGWVPGASTTPTEFTYAFELQNQSSPFRRPVTVKASNGTTDQTLLFDFLVLAQSDPTA